MGLFCYGCFRVRARDLIDAELLFDAEPGQAGLSTPLVSASGPDE